MKYKIPILTVLCLAALLTGCGGRTNRARDNRHSDVTVIHTTPAPTERRNAGDDARDLVSDAAEDVSEAVSDAARHGRDIVTDVARDASEAIADRKGDGDYRTDDNGNVAETTVRSR